MAERISKWIVLAACLMAGTSIATAHSWYPKECCNGDGNGGDCHPVPCAEIRSEGDYWAWQGYIWRKVDAQVSQDGQCHVCIAGSNGICIFLGGTS